MSFPKKITIAEVAPRDGWQNFKEFIPTEQKIALIKKMIDNGAKNVQITSYVSPKWVPQMADADEVTITLLDYVKDHDVTLTATVLNGKGVERARNLGITNLDFVISVSSEHNRRNANKTTEEVIADFENIAADCKDLNITLGTACTFGSPFGEEISPDMVLNIYKTALKYGIKSIGLADSAGISTPDNIRKTLRALIPQIGIENISIHLHDTRGMGLANAFVALEEGVTRFDTALGAMGGCPYIPGAKGNIATEDLIWLAEHMGINTEMGLADTVALSLEMTRQIGANIVSSQAALAAASEKCEN